MGRALLAHRDFPGLLSPLIGRCAAHRHAGHRHHELVFGGLLPAHPVRRTSISPSSSAAGRTGSAWPCSSCRLRASSSGRRRQDIANQRLPSLPSVLNPVESACYGPSAVPPPTCGNGRSPAPSSAWWARHESIKNPFNLGYAAYRRACTTQMGLANRPRTYLGWSPTKFITRQVPARPNRAVLLASIAFIGLAGLVYVHPSRKVLWRTHG